MTLSIVIVHYRNPERLLALIRTIPAALSGQAAEIVIVDNESTDGTLAERVRTLLPDSRVIANQTNRGFAAGVNQGVAAAKGEVVAIVNPDVELAPDFFPPQLALLASHPQAAAVGPSVYRAGGRRQLTAHRRFPTLGTVFIEYCLPLQVAISRWFSAWHPHDEGAFAHRQTHRTSHLTGVCLFARRSEFMASGGFDERFFLYLEETDWQRRLTQQGREIWYCAEARCTHFGSIDVRFAQGTEHFLRSLFRYWVKWSGPRSVFPLRLTIFAACLVSLFALLPIGLLSIVRHPWRRKVALYFSGQLAILQWIGRVDPTA